MKIIKRPIRQTGSEVEPDTGVRMSPKNGFTMDITDGTITAVVADKVKRLADEMRWEFEAKCQAEQQRMRAVGEHEGTPCVDRGSA